MTEANDLHSSGRSAGEPASPLEMGAQQCEQAAQELAMAAQHLQTAARHYRDHDIPRASAHILAAYGHKHNADGLIEGLASFHASRSVP